MAATVSKRPASRALRWAAYASLMAWASWTPGRAAGRESATPVDFNREVRPLLSDRCYACHGPDANQRQADLRLDIASNVVEATSSRGAPIVAPGDASRSELVRRITSSDPDEQMPPPESKLSLSSREAELLKRWVDEGASWDRHWSLIPIGSMALPKVRDSDWPRSELDYFVLAKLEAAGLTPAREASREELIRRVTFDITGLPPTPAEIDQFLREESAGAYEALVDRLLASPRYGERMAVDWLDIARYADTYGFQSDFYREVWRWRDWVVSAFNQNLSYDQFITWQLAGDLLPDATPEQVLATAFNRLHRQTNESGSVPEEYRMEYVADRVNTFGAAFLGLTLECARCHDHKFDPITQREYYQLASFFNNIDEFGLYTFLNDAVPTPTLLLTDKQTDQRLEQVESQIAEAEAALVKLADEQRHDFQQWAAGGEHKPTMSGLIGDYPLDSIENGRITNRADATKPGDAVDSPEIVPGKVGSAVLLNGDNLLSLQTGGDFTRNSPFSISLWLNIADTEERAVVLHRSQAWTDAGSRGYELLIENQRLSFALIHFWPGNAIRIRAVEPLDENKWIHVAITYDGSSRASGLQMYLDGARAAHQADYDNLYKEITDLKVIHGMAHAANRLKVGQRNSDRGFQGGRVDEIKIFNRALTPIEAAQVFNGTALAKVLELPASARTNEHSEQLLPYYLANHDAVYQAQLAVLQALRQKRSAILDPVDEIMVMRERNEVRATPVLLRGAYDAPGELVGRQTPAGISRLPEGTPANRLGLARWLTTSDQPLTSRVVVNRFWQSLFGRAIVNTPEDFGSQGAAPTHPGLLDWLARDFMGSGWNVKAFLKQVVLSSTYRQSSTVTDYARRQDPENLLHSRGPSHRLSAEMIRDAALAASGLLVEQVGGPPVKPYQPDGLWIEKSAQTYKRDAGAGSRRRSLYTYWKRTLPPPAMVTLDAAKRDVCTVRRQTTSTPLQALVLLNDTQYVEAARALAAEVLRPANEGAGAADRSSISDAFRRLTSRLPTSDQLDILDVLFRRQQMQFQAKPEAAQQYLSIGDLPRDEQLDPCRLAAMATVVQTIMGYDGFVMKR